MWDRLKTHFAFLAQMRSPTGALPATDLTGDLPPSAATDVDQFPSLAEVKSELARVEQSSMNRAQGVDTKAGVIVGAAGVIVTLGAAGRPSVATLVGLGLAAAAGGLAVWAFQPRYGQEISPRRLIDRGYLLADPKQTAITLVATRADFLHSDEAELAVKAARLKASFHCLFLAVAVVFAGLVIGAFKESHMTDTSPASPDETQRPSSQGEAQPRRILLRSDPALIVSPEGDTRTLERARQSANEANEQRSASDE